MDAHGHPAVRVGCSGWEYKHWRGLFYPADLPQKRWLEFYAERFDTVEINNSFYRLPQLRTVEEWRRRAPEGFLFAMKASRYLTHMVKLKDPEAPLALLFERARALGAKLGPVLYQLPPGWKPNLDRLRAFLAAIPKDVPQVLEFRNPLWYTPPIFDALREAGVALCLHDMHGSAPPREAIGPFVYVRFHGGDAKYQGGYSDKALMGWREWLAAQLERGRDVYAYFNNDLGGHAVADAERLRVLLGAETQNLLITHNS